MKLTSISSEASSVVVVSGDGDDGASEHLVAGDDEEGKLAVMAGRDKEKTPITKHVKV